MKHRIFYMDGICKGFKFGEYGISSKSDIRVQKISFFTYNYSNSSRILTFLISDGRAKDSF